MSRYVIADPDAGCGWTHIWMVQDGAGGSIEAERACRFVLDRRLVRLVHVDVEIDDIMVPATAQELNDLLDSLLNANPDVIDDPVSCGLAASNRLPAWCEKARAARAAPASRPEPSNNIPDLLRLMMASDAPEETTSETSSAPPGQDKRHDHIRRNELFGCLKHGLRIWI